MNRVPLLHAALCRRPWDKKLAVALADELTPLVGCQVVALEIVVAVVRRAKQLDNCRRANAHLRLNAAVKRRARS